MEGREHFENVELQEVINKLQKYFDPKIEVETTCQNLKITAKVPINDLDSALQTITWPLGLHFKIQDKKSSLQNKKFIRILSVALFISCWKGHICAE